MIDLNDVIDEIGAQTALWCTGDGEDTDLAAAIEYAVNQNLGLVSVGAQNVATVWPWLEKSKTKIITRFYLNTQNGVVTGANISDLVAQINTAFKQGAVGVQVFVKYDDLDSLVNQLYPIRDDLFFNRDLSIGLDISEIDYSEWNDVFDAIRKINAGAIVLAMSQDLGDKSDFVGRMFGMLNAWNDSVSCDLHFAPFLDSIRMEQAYRLMQKIQPRLLTRARFFVKY